MVRPPATSVPSCASCSREGHVPRNTSRQVRSHGLQSWSRAPWPASPPQLLQTERSLRARPGLRGRQRKHCPEVLALSGARWAAPATAITQNVRERKSGPRQTKACPAQLPADCNRPAAVRRRPRGRPERRRMGQLCQPSPALVSKYQPTVPGRRKPKRQPRSRRQRFRARSKCHGGRPLSVARVDIGGRLRTRLLNPARRPRGERRLFAPPLTQRGARPNTSSDGSSRHVWPRIVIALQPGARGPGGPGTPPQGSGGYGYF